MSAASARPDVAGASASGGEISGARLRFGSARDHLPWAVASALVLVLTVGARARMTRSDLEDHGQWWLGVESLALLSLCLAFVVRKRLYGTRLGRLRPYYLAHVWTGLVWGGVTVLHADLQARGPLLFTLAILAALSFASGLAGLGVNGLLRTTLARAGGGEALVEDLMAARDRLDLETATLIETQPETLRGIAAELAGPRPTLWSALAAARDPVRAEIELARSRARIEAIHPAPPPEQAASLLRIAGGAVERTRITAILHIQALQHAWLSAHITVSVPMLVLTATHVSAVAFY